MKKISIYQLSYALVGLLGAGIIRAGNPEWRGIELPGGHEVQEIQVSPSHAIMRMNSVMDKIHQARDQWPQFILNPQEQTKKWLDMALPMITQCGKDLCAWGKMPKNAQHGAMWAQHLENLRKAYQVGYLLRNLGKQTSFKNIGVFLKDPTQEEKIRQRYAQCFGQYCGTQISVGASYFLMACGLCSEDNKSSVLQAMEQAIAQDAQQVGMQFAREFNNPSLLPNPSS